MYAGNLPHELSESELKQEFAAFGAVDSVVIIKDKFNGTPKGFGFVEMPVRSEGEAAVAGLNEKEIKGRKIVVNEARPMSSRKSNNRNEKGGWNNNRHRSY
jgi:RNA recognition motif-containing protein